MLSVYLSIYLFICKNAWDGEEQKEKEKETQAHTLLSTDPNFGPDSITLKSWLCENQELDT